MAITEAPEYPEKIDAAVLKIAGVVVLGAIMSILDITVVNVALPTFQTVFGSVGEPIAYSHVAWTVTAYTLALATVIPMTGWAADRFGTKRLYLTALDPLHGRLGAVCRRRLNQHAHPVPGHSGPRRRHADASRHDHHDEGSRSGPDGPPDGHPRRPDAARPDPRAHPGRLAHRQRQLALDLPHQRPHRRCRLRLRLRRPAQRHPGAVGGLRLPRHAAALARARPVPLRGLQPAGEGRRLHCPAGVAVDADRRPADARVHLARLPARAPPAGPAVVQEPQPDGVDDHDVPVRRRLLRRPAARSHLLPADPRRVHAGCRAADRAAGHRRDDHHAHRRRSGRQDPRRTHRPGRAWS